MIDIPIMKPTAPSARLKVFFTRPMSAFSAPEKMLKIVTNIPLKISKTEATRLLTPFAMSDMLMNVASLSLEWRDLLFQPKDECGWCKLK